MLSMEEQEKVDALKSWWKAYGVYVWIVGLVIVFGGGGGAFWHHYQGKHALRAAQKFSDLQAVIEARNLEASQSALDDISQGFAQTIYADLAGLKVSRLAYEEGNVDVAVKNLRRIFSDGLSLDTKALAGLRLAAILIDQNEADEALNILNELKGGAYSMLVSDLQADALFTKGELKEAISSLDIALEKTENSSAWRSIIEMKRDSLESQR